MFYPNQQSFSIRCRAAPRKLTKDIVVAIRPSSFARTQFSLLSHRTLETSRYSCANEEGKGTGKKIEEAPRAITITENETLGECGSSVYSRNVTIDDTELDFSILSILSVDKYFSRKKNFLLLYFRTKKVFFSFR